MISWSYDGGNGGAGVLSVTIDFAVIGDWYDFRTFSDTGTPDAHQATGTTETFTISNIGNTNPRKFVCFLRHGDNLSVPAGSPDIASNIFLGGTASVTGEPYDAIVGATAWSYNSGTQTVSVTFTGDGVSDYFVFADPDLGFDFSGTPVGPSAGTLTASLTLTTPTPGKEFVAVLENYSGDINGDTPDYACRLFVVGTTSSGSEGNPDAGGTPPTVTSYSPSHGCNTDVITITGSGFTGATAVKFNGVNATSFTVVDDNTITATVPNAATTGGISVTTPGGTGVGPTFTVDAGPANDDYPTTFGAAESDDYYITHDATNRMFISGGCFDWTNGCATREAGEPDPYPAVPPVHTVWVVWQADFDGDANFWLSPVGGSPFTQGVMSAYDYVEGPVSGLGAPLAQGDDDIGSMPSITFAVVNGNDYILQIDNEDAHGGAFTVNWKRSDGTPPANDDFVDAEAIDGLCGITTGSFGYATAQCDEPPDENLSGPYNTVWYSYAPDVEGTTLVRVDADPYYNSFINIQVFTGSSLDTLVEVGTAPPLTPITTTSLTFPTHVGVTYYIRVDSGERDNHPTNPTTFTLLVESGQSDWAVRVGTFISGASSFNTGLARKPDWVVIWVAGSPDESFVDGFRLGFGAAISDLTQWGSSYAYPWIKNGLTVSGTQYGQNRFSTTNVISAVDLLGGVYAEAAATAFNTDGTIHLTWGTDPGDGLFLGFMAGVGFDVAIGHGNFDISTLDGGHDTVSITPGGYQRVVFAGGIANTVAGPDFQPTQAWGAVGWVENTLGPGPGVVSQQLASHEDGINWYGPAFWEGNYQSGAQDFFGIANHELDPYLVGALTVDLQIFHNAYWIGDYGWLSLGGCGWHAISWLNGREGGADVPTQPLAGADTHWWTEAGTAAADYDFGGVGPFTSSAGMFDYTDEQFSFATWVFPSDGASYHEDWPGTFNIRTGDVLAAAEMIKGADFPYEVEAASEIAEIVTSLPGRGVPGATSTATPGWPVFSQAGGILFGNWVPPVLLGIVSFSHIKSSQRRAGLQIR